MELKTAIKATIVIAVLALAPAQAQGQVCNVPTLVHTTVQRAIDDTRCTTINLSDQSYPESLRISRSLTIAGPAALADIAGHVRVDGSGTVVAMNNVMVQNGCTPDAMLVTDGGQLNSSRLEVVYVDTDPCPSSLAGLIFIGDFEIGNASQWTIAIP